ncbi:hypothetical protein [Paraburkholderia jirisanensis]
MSRAPQMPRLAGVPVGSLASVGGGSGHSSGRPTGQAGAVPTQHRLALGAAWPEHYALDMHPSFQCTVGAQPGSFAIMGNPRQWILHDGKAYRLVLDTQNATYAVVHWRDPDSARYPVRYDRASGAWLYDGAPAAATAAATAAAIDATAGGPHDGPERERKVHELLGHLSLQDLLLQSKQRLASEWGLQLDERVRTRERLAQVAQWRLNHEMRRAAQGAPEQRAQAEALRNHARMRRLEARDARSEYLGFIRLQPALHLQRQRYEVWRLSHKVAAVQPRADTRVLDPMPPAIALGKAPAAEAGGVETRGVARQGDATQGATTRGIPTPVTTTQATTTPVTTTPIASPQASSPQATAIESAAAETTVRQH